MSPISRFVTREAACAMLLGSIPFAITAYFDGVGDVVASLKALNPSAAMLSWYGILVFLPGIVGMAQMRFPNKSLTDPGFLGWLGEVADETSTSLLGLYRAACGFSALVTIPVVVIEPSPRNLAVASFMLLFSSGCLLMCCVLSAMRKHRHGADDVVMLSI